ncbi:MAG: efflux RND transporter periplasmic adaptor subunit, partial [Pyrinomonadaceae bacterium]
PATPAFEVADASSLDLVANLPAQYLSRVKTGNLAVVKVEPFPEREFTGGVVNVAPSVDSQTNTVAVRVRLSNEHDELKPGLFADARVAVEIRPNALAVPEAALVVEGEDAFVFVVKREGKDEGTVEKRKVTTGIRDEGRVEIVEGLEDNEAVVTAGAFGLSDDSKIKVTENATTGEPEAGEPDASDKKGATDKQGAGASAGAQDGKREEK